ncbi:hydrogenase expression protein HypA [Methanoculleus taiwanensis]|uniref:Hydrogenase expression protein HypA n=1 Tax=Methanoculleus taiwanensis TaxID=1550565 RepID=A0A498H1C7_9EURY|nr:hydrophobe/amphiphile efflux-3 (HAE3) family transporter [Methanoculleus taiwanensis]RXE56135.1 hydrogenase expression protein HypA [Methanoculleus taiwanensis]
MRSPFELLADAIASRPFAVAGIFAFVFIVALFGMTMVSMETGDGTYVDKTTSRGALLNHYKETYGSDAIMIIFEADDVISPDVLAYIDFLEEDIRNERYIAGVSGIVTLMKGANGGAVPSSRAEITEIEATVPEDLRMRYMPSQLMTITAITLEPGVSSAAQGQVLAGIDSLISISNPPPGVSVTVSGSPAFQVEMRQEMGSSMGMLIAGAMLLMVLAVMLLFSHVRYRLLSVAVVAVGLILTFGVMGLFGIPISMTVIAAFPVLIGIGIDYAIQFHSRLDECAQQMPLPAAVRAAVTNAGPSILIAMGATSMGFIAMFLAPVPMVADFGVTCTIGVVCCYLAALVIVPTFALIMQYRPKAHTGVLDDVASCELDWKGCETVPPHAEGTRGSLIERYDAMLGKLAYTVAKHPIPVILLFCVVAAVGFQLDTRVPINADEETFVPSEMPALLDMKKITRTMGATSSIPVVIAADDVLDPEVLSWIHDFGAYEQSDEKITGVTSIATLIAQYNGGSLPTTKQEIAAVVDRIPEESKNRYLNGNMEAVLQFTTVEMEMDASRSLVQDIEKDIGWFQPPAGVHGQVTGTLEMFAGLMDDIKESKTGMTVLGFAFILGFLLLIYRKINAVSPLIPIVLIVGWNGAIMYLLGIDYTPLTAVLGSMTIGVASEYTILIMERCEEELARGMEISTAIQTAVQKIGTAITVSGMTTVFGFSALILSSFNIISNFGVVTVITVGFSLVGAIFVMPAVLSLMYHLAAKRDAGAEQGSAA